MSRAPLPCFLLLALAVGGASCDSPVVAPGSTVPGRCQGEAPVVSPQRTDILFVIDNSGSMAEEQAALAVELPALLEELQRGAGVAQDFRVGVITTSVYQRAAVASGEDLRYFPDQSGRLQPVPDAQGQPTDERFLEDEDPLLLEKFRRLVVRGTAGSGQETPFEAVRLAVSAPLATMPLAEGGNGGFLRDGARLLVVVVSDEDDCSSTQRPPPVLVTTDSSRDACLEQAEQLTPVAEYQRLLRQLEDGTGALREVLWATIGPVGLTDKQVGVVLETTPEGQQVLRNVDCPNSFGAGLRQREMAERFDVGLKNLDSICRPSYRATLVAIATLATTSQSLEVVNLPDPRLVQVRLTREDGSVQTCSVAGGGLSYEPSTERQAARLYFQSACPRLPGDQRLEFRLVCAG